MIHPRAPTLKDPPDGEITRLIWNDPHHDRIRAEFERGQPLAATPDWPGWAAYGGINFDDVLAYAELPEAADEKAHEAEGDVYELSPPPPPAAVTETPVAAPAAGLVDSSGDPDGPVAAAGAAAGVSGMAGTLIDQRRAELADALSAEYQARLAPVRDKRGEANAQIVRISNQPERTEEDFDRLNELHDHARAMDALLFKIAEHLATMQTALFRKSADELAKFDPTYGWPEASA